MIAENMKPLVKNNSVIRQMFEEGDRLRAIYGADKVFDFSLGNPNVPAPAQVKDAIIDILEHENPVKVHGYMSNAGFPEVRRAIAESLNKRFNTDFGAHNILMTVGAGSALNVAFRILLNPLN
jgi:aspartate aminotransferase